MTCKHLHLLSALAVDGPRTCADCGALVDFARDGRCYGLKVEVKSTSSLTMGDRLPKDAPFDYIDGFAAQDARRVTLTNQARHEDKFLVAGPPAGQTVSWSKIDDFEAWATADDDEVTKLREDNEHLREAAIGQMRLSVMHLQQLNDLHKVLDFFDISGALRPQYDVGDEWWKLTLKPESMKRARQFAASLKCLGPIPGTAANAPTTKPAIPLRALRFGVP